MRTFRFSYRINQPGHVMHDEETIVRATSRTEADSYATRRAVAWKVDLQFVGVRHGTKLEIQIPLEQLPASWRDEVAA